MDSNSFNIMKQYVDKKISSNLNGLSAYQIAVKNGYTGTESQWLASLGQPANLSDYALINSPSFAGVPTAPTAEKGTNSLQVATTAFVYNALKPSLLITISAFPNNIANATVTLTLQGSDPLYTITTSIPTSGIVTISPDYIGIYDISFNNSKIKSAPSIQLGVLSSYTLNCYWSDSITYTLVIDKTNSNPETACTYADDALGMIKGSSEWDTKPIFKDIKPCVFQNGEVNYYLNPSNWNEKADGTASCLTGEDGDVMIEFPKFAYKIKTNNINNTITVSISTDTVVIANDSDYTYDAFSRLEEGDLNCFYKGAFKGYIDGNGKLRSISGVKPTTGKSLLQGRTAAQNNGAHYQQSTYAQLKALQCLYLIKHGSRDSQVAAGQGATSGPTSSLVTGYNTENVANISSATPTADKGMNYKGYSNTHMRLFGIEDLWGNVWEWIEGIEIDSSSWNIITSWNSFSNEGLTATYKTTLLNIPSSSNWTNWMADASGDSNTGFIMIDGTNGSSSTYWADYTSFNKGMVLNFGGRWTYGGKAGIFCLNMANVNTKEDANTGLRLSYV